MKRLIAFLMVVFLLTGMLAGCGDVIIYDADDDKVNDASTEPTKGTEAADPTDPDGDPTDPTNPGDNTDPTNPEDNTAPADPNTPSWPTVEDGPAGYVVEMVIKDYGTITLQLDRTAAPITVDNFVKLVEEGFYDGLTFHRIIEGFMMQGGDPWGNGYGGSGTNIKGEFAANGWNNPISHVRGVISMARSGYSYDSASSQFFIVHQDYPSLNGQYAAFGWVTEGMDVVDAICESAVPSDYNGSIPAANQPRIESIKIVEVLMHE